MSEFGHIFLTFLFPLTLFTTVVAFMAGRTHRESLYQASRNGVYAVWIVTTLAILALEGLLLQGDFSNAFVYGNTNRALPVFYKIVALWAGHDGSLLFWTWIITSFSALVVWQNRNKNRELMPYVIFTMMGTTVFFATLNLFVANPFDTWMQSMGGTMMPIAAQDGRGLNPLLQHPAMIIHPPILYLGYVGTVVPFAFAIAALITGRLGTGWIKITRRWALVSWGFLSAGILLGGKWAYVELGWGGYWAWDPVENASLLPWLTSTAYVHSVMIQERKGMLKIWNMALVIGTYLLAIFGTFLTRSGIVSSVHAFANSGIGPAFSSFLLIALIASIVMIIWRRDQLRSEEQFESLVSRESGFMFNNLLFVLATVAVMWGTLFPVISQLFTGEQITVGPPWFNTIMIPIGLAVLLLTGVGPLLAWRRTSVESLRKSFGYPFVASIVLLILLLLMGMRDGWALGSFAISFFVMWIIASEFLKGARIRAKNTGENFLQAMGKLTMKNTRRYGGYIIHAAIVIIFIGFTGAAFNEEARQVVSVGGSFDFGGYTVKCIDKGHTQNENYRTDYVYLELYKNGRKVDDLRPQKRLYFASEQPTSEVAIYSTLREDIYVVSVGESQDGSQAIVQIYRNPLVKWVWIGSFVLVAGTILVLIPNYREKRKPITHTARARKEVNA
ncbi:MAG: heme lyase CcmF/NrfE family subunit [Lentisphaeria bacterium]|nr:heme lyase CcmF/NrfE family subunit [Candidatus Neomarinimicrobiota bacterium]MCF7841549.1 heme lyase CcmF/NrfE family subunit [Lentisphaeria bacterium]